jgi:hypothetical protein
LYVLLVLFSSHEQREEHWSIESFGCPLCLCIMQGDSTVMIEDTTYISTLESLDHRARAVS